MPRLSENQKKILEILEVKPEMTTKEIAKSVIDNFRILLARRTDID